MSDTQPAPAPAPAPASESMGAFPSSAQISSPPPEGTSEATVPPAPAAAPAPAPDPFAHLFSPPDRTVHEHQPNPEAVSALEYDPFAAQPTPPPAPPTPPAAVPPAPPVSAPTAQGPSGPATPAVSSPPTPPPDPRDTELRLLKEQNETLRRAMEHLAVGQQVRQAPGPGAVQGQDEVQIPEVYQRVAIPEDLLQQIGSDDPATWANGLNSVIRGVAAMVHREVTRSIRSELPERIGRHVQDFTQQSQQAQHVQQDYYSKYPHHANVKPLVAQIGEEVQRQFKINGWNTDLRDAIGARVNERLMAMAGALGMVPTPPPPAAAPQMVPQPQVPQPQPPRAPHVFGSTVSPSRSGLGEGSPNSPEAIASLLY